VCVLQWSFVRFTCVARLRWVCVCVYLHVRTRGCVCREEPTLCRLVGKDDLNISSPPSKGVMSTKASKLLGGRCVCVCVCVCCLRDVCVV